MNKKQLFNDGWFFKKTAIDVTWEERDKWEPDMKPVDIPHDWLIYNTLDLYESSIGWYRKKFNFDATENKVFLRFEGVYMDSVVYVNGKAAKEWKYGYSTFDADITEYLVHGDNEVVVKVNHIAPNSRWYSGAGIYRNVWLMEVPHTHIRMDGIYVSTEEAENGYLLLVDTEISREDENDYDLEYRLYDREEIVFQQKREILAKQDKACESFFVEKPKRWDVKEPNLYRLEVELLKDGQCVQREAVRVGFRTVCFTPDKGLLLNGRKLRLNGACDHHDLGALGAAFSKVAMRRKLNIMRSMGINAIRTSHTMPAVELMELADEMGLLVVSEGFDMWEMQKNPYDYGRFFKEWAEIDVESWVRRDRSHPSIIMWSIGNEIPDTHADAHGQEITTRLMNAVYRWDYRRNGKVTIGSNYMPWENAQKCADIVKFAGYNYAEKYYAEHHEQHPDWIIYGSETASVVQSRGVYHFPLERATLIEEDEQCSALGNSTTGWGAKNVEYNITMDRDTECSCGQFIWTAFDYIGEPTPYQTKNSYFGQVDTAGFPKDSFYVYQAEWTDYKENPMVHVYPYWDFNPGQEVDIRICSNAPEVELFINGESQGRRCIDHVYGTELQPHWKAVYVPGSIEAVAYDEKGNVIAKEERHSFGDAAKLVLQTKENIIKANGEDMAFIEISAVDKEGYPVENASDYVQVSVSGAGRLVGLDNGDSSDYDQYKGTVRKLFQGKLLAMVAAKKEAGEIKIRVESTDKNVVGTELVINAVEADIMAGISCRVENTDRELAAVKDGYVPVRKLELKAIEGQKLSKELTTVTVEALIYPENATDKDVIWKLADAGGLESRNATIEVLPEGNRAKITALGDGALYVRCMSKDGTNKVKVISMLDMQIEGMGQAFVSPYEPVIGVTYGDSKGHIGKGIKDCAITDKENESYLIYQNLYFGDYGSDQVTLSIFAHDDDPHAIQIWKGVPAEAGSELLGDVIYHKKTIWEVFQSETYTLKKRLSGVQTITIVTQDKIYLEHFTFAKPEKAYAKLNVAETAVIYGDSYVRKEDRVEQIGNNVSLSYEEMNFELGPVSKITICGRTPLPKNTIQIRVTGESEMVQVLEFPGSDDYIVKTFELPEIIGKNGINFVFLPGCNFDFMWFRFEK